MLANYIFFPWVFYSESNVWCDWTMCYFDCKFKFSLVLFFLLLNFFSCGHIQWVTLFNNLSNCCHKNIKLLGDILVVFTLTMLGNYFLSYLICFLLVFILFTLVHTIIWNISPSAFVHLNSLNYWFLRLKTPVVVTEDNRLLEISLQLTFLSHLLGCNSNWFQVILNHIYRLSKNFILGHSNVMDGCMAEELLISTLHLQDEWSIVSV